MTSNGMKVLVVAAHPDDEVLGAGGAIARHIEEGDDVSVLILGEGIAAREGLTADEVNKQQAALEMQTVDAMNILGLQAPRREKFADNAFDSVKLLSIIQSIEKVMRDADPELIYTHHAGDVNVDHRITAEAVDAAVRPMKEQRVREVRAFEVPSSSEWNFTRDQFKPNVFVALTEGQLQKKINAMRAYGSEMRDFPHPRSARYLDALARVRGGQSGSEAAEAFELVYKRT